MATGVQKILSGSMEAQTQSPLDPLGTLTARIQAEQAATRQRNTPTDMQMFNFLQGQKVFKQSQADRLRELLRQQRKDEREDLTFGQSQADRNIRMNDAQVQRERNAIKFEAWTEEQARKKVANQTALQKALADKITATVTPWVEALGTEKDFIDFTKEEGAQSFGNYDAIMRDLDKNYNLADDDDITKRMLANIHRDMKFYYNYAPTMVESFSELEEPNKLFMKMYLEERKNLSAGPSGFLGNRTVEYDPSGTGIGLPAGNMADIYNITEVK